MRLVAHRTTTALAGVAALGLMGFVGVGTASAAAPHSHPGVQSATVVSAPAKTHCKTNKNSPKCTTKKSKKSKTGSASATGSTGSSSGSSTSTGSAR